LTSLNGWDSIVINRKDNMSALKKKSETCGEQLRRMCKDIADDITAGNPEGKDSKTASAWMEDTYDIRYIVDREKRYMGAEILVAGGGPTIWVNLYTGYVEGYWGGDRVNEPFIDNLDLDGYCEEMYGC
tara:strand:- start:246 stop:632 length:387 start_codon:yes stop_codon:yes gene_type:complete